MKKYLLLSLVCMLGMSMKATAQNADYKNTISATAGLNAFQFFNLLNNYDDGITQNLNFHATASYGLTYDYGINNWFSIGLGGAYNKAKLTADQISVTRNDGTVYTGPIDAKGSRTSIALRPLFHYGNGGRVDMYSGVRMGVNIVNVDIKSDEPLDPKEIDGFFRGNTAYLNFQIIPFGLRGYITPNFAIGFEAAFGAPHYAALQLSYRM